jgi:hypothetical protein
MLCLLFEKTARQPSEESDKSVVFKSARMSFLEGWKNFF